MIIVGIFDATLCMLGMQYKQVLKEMLQILPSLIH